ncbi:hypothetical protein [Nonomuraea ferruginea]|uniref:Uncharacterized protein n=1 Tax=Nonomuraea ferruginea TaxID=46174 RepID=A0ABT4SSM7_9ACTN|nr:hypothetical protein [Nonomuraea ferruginea]MDA0640269.1 hypothetical protein [Nonomuraea ferruginea]
MFGSKISRFVLAAVVLAAGVGWMAGSEEEPVRDGEQFTACMRAHGLPGFPEVALSSAGLVNLDIKGERVDVLSGKYGAAVEACEPLLPVGSRLPGAPTAPTAPPFPS